MKEGKKEIIIVKRGYSLDSFYTENLPIEESENEINEAKKTGFVKTMVDEKDNELGLIIKQSGDIENPKILIVPLKTEDNFDGFNWAIEHVSDKGIHKCKIKNKRW